jgi:hypothetical protein
VGGEVAEFDVVVLGVAAQDLERSGLVEVVSLHQDSLGLSDEFAAVQCRVESGLVPRFREGEATCRAKIAMNAMSSWVKQRRWVQ